jgi:hypothetical protein
MNNFTTAKASLAVVLALTLALLPVSVQPARAEVTTNVWLPLGDTFFEDVCVVGTLQFSGMIHIVARTEGDGKVGVHVNLKAPLTNLDTGDEYMFMEIYNEQLTFDDDGSWTMNWVDNVQFVGTGPLLTLTWHLVVTETSDGGLTLKNWVSECH